MDISQRILSQMAQCGLSYRSLAAKMGKNHMTVYNWTHGTQVKEKDLGPLATYLKTTPQWLRYGNKLGNHELDTALIARILRVINDISNTQKLRLPPDKLAALLTTVYDLVIETGSLDEKLVERLLNLAK